MNDSQLSALKQEEETFFLTVDEQVTIEELGIRKGMAERIQKIFISTNIAILILVVILSILDWCFIGAGLMAPNERVIGSRVVYALIGATTVQLGAIMFAMAAYLFPRNGGRTSG